jgi:hypothetical protein
MNFDEIKEDFLKHHNPENTLQKDCEAYLKYKGFLYIHIPNRVFRGVKQDSVKDLKSKLDLYIFLPKGKTLVVELKTGSKMSDGQIDEAAKMDELGHTVYLILNLDDFIELIEKEIK